MRSCQTRIREGETVLTAVHQLEIRGPVSGRRPHLEETDSKDVEFPTAIEPVSNKLSETYRSSPLLLNTQS